MIPFNNYFKAAKLVLGKSRKAGVLFFLYSSTPIINKLPTEHANSSYGSSHHMHTSNHY